MSIENALKKVLGFGVKTYIEKAIEGGWEPHASNFFDSEEENQVIPKPYLIEVGDEVTDFECPHELFVLSFDEEKYPNVGFENSRLGFTLVGAFLSPSAWQAVGKVEGWGWEQERTFSFTFEPDDIHDMEKLLHFGRKIPMWRYYWFRMIDALVDGI